MVFTFGQHLPFSSAYLTNSSIMSFSVGEPNRRAHTKLLIVWLIAVCPESSPQYLSLAHHLSALS